MYVLIIIMPSDRREKNNKQKYGERGTGDGGGRQKLALLQ